MKVHLSVKILLLVTGITGCGYTTRSFIYNHLKTIYVQPLVNKIDITGELPDRYRYRTYRPLLESDITKAIVDRFLFDGNLKPAKKEEADVILTGELIDYIRDPLRYTADKEVEEYRLTLAVNITLKDVRQDKVLWQERNFVGDTTYFTSGSLAKSEADALTYAIEDLARRVVERTVEQW